MISLELLHDIVRGPLALTAFLIFSMGTTYQVVRFFFLSRKIHKIHSKPIRLTKTFSMTNSPVKSRAQRLAAVKVSIFGVHPVMTSITTVFHVCLAPFITIISSLLMYLLISLTIFLVHDCSQNLGQINPQQE